MESAALVNGHTTAHTPTVSRRVETLSYEGMLRALFEQGPQGVLVFDREMRVAQCNQAFATWVGSTREQLLGLDLTALRDHRPLETLRGALEGKTGTYEGSYLLTSSNKETVVRLVASPLRNEANEVVGAMTVFEDVSQKEAASRAIQESQERYRQLVELAPEPIFVQVDRKVVFVNPATVHTFRAASADELLGLPTTALVHEDSSRLLDERMARVFAGEALGFVEIRFLRRDGTVGDAEVASMPLLFEGRPGVLTVARDISFRKEAEREKANAEHQRALAEEAARKADRRGAAQFHAIPVPTYVWQRQVRDGVEDLVLVDYNEAATTITRGTVTRTLGRTLREYYADLPDIITDVVETLRSGIRRDRDMEYTLRTGDTRRFSVRYIPVPPDLVIVYTEDLTEKIELEEKLRQAQKMEAVGLLAGGVAHDFNNLLTVIGFYAETLAENLADGPLGGDAQEIAKAAQRAAELTKQLLAFSRKQVLKPRSVDLNECLAGLRGMLERLIGEDIEITFDTDASLGPIHADPGQVEQVVMNLAINARDAMPDGGKLILRTSNVVLDAGSREATDLRPGPYVRLVVEDTGQGMDAATASRIFEPFFTTKELSRGTGLGLSTVYGIVKQSGGSIDVVSQPGKGARFSILFPTHLEGAAATLPRPRTLRPDSDTALVLLVEDEAQVRAIARRILERMGHRVLEARDGREALQVARSVDDRIDLLVTDMVMPLIGGRELYVALSAERPGLRVLYMSGYTDDELLRRGIMEPGSAFMQKPFTAETLRTQVRSVLEDAREQG